MTAFLSYAREDLALATTIRDEIDELGIAVSIDNELRGGQDWWDQLCTWIETCDVFVIALSDAWLASEACQAEVGYALALGRPVLPLSVGPVALDELPLELKRFQVITYDPDSKDSYKRMVRVLVRLGAAPPLPDPMPERPLLPESYVDPFKRSLAADTLSLEDQVSLFAVLKLHTSDPRRHADALDLLRELRRRRDLAVAVAEDIDAFLGSVVAVTEPEADAEPELPTATIVLTRPKQAFVGRAGAMHLEVDGERVASVDNDSQVEISVPAGPHVLQATTWAEAIGSRSDELEVVLAPGASLQLRVRFKGSLKGGLELLQTA